MVILKYFFRMVKIHLCETILNLNYHEYLNIKVV